MGWAMGQTVNKCCVNRSLIKLIDQELTRIASKINTDLGYDPHDKIALHDVSKF